MPWRTTVASTLIVLATIVAIEAILLTTQLIAWVVVIGFFAVVFAPAVRRVQDHVGGRRAIATVIVVFGTLATVLGILTVFVMPARTQSIGIITDLPGTIKDAGSAHGAVGKIVSRLHLNNYIKQHEADLERAANKGCDPGGPAERELEIGTASH